MTNELIDLDIIFFSLKISMSEMMTNLITNKKANIWLYFASFFYLLNVFRVGLSLTSLSRQPVRILEIFEILQLKQLKQQRYSIKYL